MDKPSAHPGDLHYITRSGWLRAAVLGANDGIVSISSLIVGMAAAVPLLAAFFAPEGMIIPVVLAETIITLAALGALGAKAGAAPIIRATLRVVFWGIFAMAVTYGIGLLFGVSVS